MGHRRFAAQWLKLLAAAGLVGSALVGCSGDDGTDGSAGPSGVVIAPVTGSTALTIAITGAAVSSPPVVNFRVTNQNGESVIGLTDTDFRFNIAKLVPGTFGNPYNWQSYLNRVQGGAVVGTQERKATGSAWGSLVANGDGTYTYTFATDITSAAANPCPAPCTDAAGKPLDLSYQPNLTHRVGIQLNNTALPRANGTYDFVPAGGAAFRRDIVRTGKCNECHGQLAAHGGGLRVETKLCVTCHNPGSWDNSPGNIQTLDFKVMIHKIHRGDELPSVVAGGTYKIGTADFSDVAFPQDIRNCTKCHDGADPATPQGDNWKTQPSREACGSCHDNVNFATGAGHAGGIKDNSTCLACHSTGGEVGPVATSHIPVEMTSTTPGSEAGRASYQDKLPAGASKMTYEIKANGVTVSGTPKRATVVFRVLRDDVAQTFNAFGTGVKLMDDFSLIAGATTSPGNSGPAFYLAYAVPQDAITAPADFNVSANVSLLNVWDGTRGTLSGPDANGWYTAALGGGSSSYANMDIPASAVMVTAGFGFGAFVQTNVPGYPGGLTLITPVTQQVAASYTARRVIAAKAKCNNCHATLGTEPTFHGGNRNDPTVCAFCHYAQRTSNGWSGRSNSFIHAIHGARKRTVNFNWHAVSATEGYWQIRFPGILKNCETCHVTGAYDYSGSAYTETLMSNLPYTIVATGIMSPTSFTRSPYVDSTGTVDYGVNFSYTPSTGVTVQAAGTTLATSPIATACFACHDNDPARAHMEWNGASIYQPRSAALAKTETCMLCHGPGKVAAIADMHAK